MGFSGFEVHWNTAFHAMSFTNKTVRIMVGVTFSLQRNQEIWVSSWGADLSLEGINWTEWFNWWWLWYWELAGAKLGRRGCKGLFPKPALLPPLTQRGGRETMLSPSSSLVQGLGGKCGWLQGRNGITVKLSSFQNGVFSATRIALPLVSGGVGRRRVGLICSKGSLSSLCMSCSDIWTWG